MRQSHEIIRFIEGMKMAHMLQKRQSFRWMRRPQRYPRGALKQINEAVSLWLETAREFGDPVPEPKGKRLMLV